MNWQEVFDACTMPHYCRKCGHEIQVEYDLDSGDNPMCYVVACEECKFDAEYVGWKSGQRNVKYSPTCAIASGKNVGYIGHDAIAR